MKHYDAFRQLDVDLPTPNVYRTASGAPGSQYWQQRADYKIEVELDDQWPAALVARDLVLKSLEEAKAPERGGIEKSLDAGIVLPDPDGILSPFASAIQDMCEVSRLRCDASATEVVVEDLREAACCERSWRRDETVAKRPNGSMLSQRDWEAVEAQQD